MTKHLCSAHCESWGACDELVECLENRNKQLESALKALIENVADTRLEPYDNSHDEEICTACYMTRNANQVGSKIEHTKDCAWKRANEIIQ